MTIADAAPILGDCNIGDSIAVNGACLTVVEFHKEEQGGWFTVWLANETLDRTDLGMRLEFCRGNPPLSISNRGAQGQ